MESLWKVADEVRLAEERIVRRKRAFARTRDEVSYCARDAVASPGVLASAVVVGFVLGRLLGRPHRDPVASPTRPVTGGGWMMAALGPLLRVGYGAAVEALWSRALQPRDGDGQWSSERAAAANEDGRAALLAPIKTTRAA